MKLNNHRVLPEILYPYSGQIAEYEQSSQVSFQLYSLKTYEVAIV
ncbi:hypothetical protein [Coleofasciculus sp.]